MNRVPGRTVLHLYRIVHVLLVNKFLDYLILAFYFLFVKMIKHISANYRRRRLPDGHRGIGCDFDLIADENSVYGSHSGFPVRH